MFCNSISPYRIVMAASRLLGVAAACVILWSFAAVHRKSYWTGCIKAAIVICQQIFSSLVLVIFLSKFLLKSASKSCFFFALAPRRSGCGAAISHALCFSVKVAAAGDERYLVWLRSFWCFLVLPWCSATCGCSCARSSMRLLNLWLQIALSWLKDVAWGLCWGGSRR